VEVSSSERWGASVPLSIHRCTKTVQIVLPQNKMKEVLGELHGEFIGRHLGTNNPWTRLDSQPVGYTQADIERCCQQ
jgi:hypothetical protein